MGQAPKSSVKMTLDSSFAAKLEEGLKTSPYSNFRPTREAAPKCDVNLPDKEVRLPSPKCAGHHRVSIPAMRYVGLKREIIEEPCYYINEFCRVFITDSAGPCEIKNSCMSFSSSGEENGVL